MIFQINNEHRITLKLIYKLKNNYFCLITFEKINFFNIKNLIKN